jgi:hypothetical protein
MIGSSSMSVGLLGEVHHSAAPVPTCTSIARATAANGTGCRCGRAKTASVTARSCRSAPCRRPPRYMLFRR